MIRIVLLIVASVCAMPVAIAQAPPSYGVCAAYHTSDGSNGLGACGGHVQCAWG